MNIYNPILVDVDLIKINMKNKFISLYGLLHNQHLEFYIVNNYKRLEKLTENDLHSINAYIRAINIIVNISFMQQYIQ
ncbi:10144_t:CDS:2 [Funneliformis mosseae]|uniref:10144_t:CDS:1 n=1 Tax=Funneliformis mosseae TaxID=27381 RepID=A0A9N9D3X7_FUNMO|nr:10144_t:CDS:2 [Funneliformis mosseae]